jgi:uncharacterized protein
MTLHAASLFTQARPVRRRERILQYPLVRILVAILFLAPALAIRNLTVIFVVERLPAPASDIVGGVVDVIAVILIFLCYRFFVRRVEEREPREVMGPAAAAEFARGGLLALALVGCTVALMAWSGAYAVESFGSVWTLVQAVLLFGTGALVQVVVFRLILFRLVEELTGTWIAFAAISIAFGMVHALNGNLTPTAFLSLTMGDLLFVAAFVKTRRVWLVWGIHAGWNFFQDGVFGMPNSGVTRFPSWLTPRLGGPEWLSGGSFGIESSIVALVLTLAAGVWIGVLAIREGQLVRPRWTRG